MTTHDRTRAYHRCLKAADEHEALAATDALLAQLPKAPAPRSKAIADLYWRAAECGQPLAYARLCQEGEDPHPSLSLEFAASGGHPDLLRHFLTLSHTWDQAPDWATVLRNLITGHGHEGIHPRAGEALDLVLKDPRTQGLALTKAAWDQLGVYPRAEFLPALQAAYRDPERANHPLLVLNAWAMSLASEDRSASGAQVLLELDGMLSEAEKRTWMASDLFVFAQYERLGLLEVVLAALEDKHPELPVATWRTRCREVLGEGVFPEEMAAHRETRLQERPASPPSRARARS